MGRFKKKVRERMRWTGESWKVASKNIRRQLAEDEKDRVIRRLRSAKRLEVDSDLFLARVLALCVSSLHASLDSLFLPGDLVSVIRTRFLSSVGPQINGMLLPYKDERKQNVQEDNLH